jgi:hypothetical protein
MSLMHSATGAETIAWYLRWPQTVTSPHAVTSFGMPNDDRQHDHGCDGIADTGTAHPDNSPNSCAHRLGGRNLQFCRSGLGSTTTSGRK